MVQGLKINYKHRGRRTGFEIIALRPFLTFRSVQIHGLYSTLYYTALKVKVPMKKSENLKLSKISFEIYFLHKS